MGPAYGNRPSTNLRGTGATLWGFDGSGGAGRVARWLRNAKYLRCLEGLLVGQGGIKAMRAERVA
jgi:hypothetical protein